MDLLTATPQTMTPAPCVEPPKIVDLTPPWPEIDSVPLDATFHLAPVSGWYALVKPSIEFATAVLLFVFLWPFILLGWLLVKWFSPGPGFYVQTRCGRNQKPYRIIKLRSMHHNIELKTGVQWASKNDPRVFGLGKFLRATHLDELPQIFNVLRGEMSLVGARPERPEVIQSKSLRELVPGYDLRLLIKPGVTGLAQVQLPADNDIRGVRHKIAYDLYYVINRSLWLDIRIILATICKSAGMNRDWLRKLFFLPSRDDVAQQFLALVHPPLKCGSVTLAPV